MNPIAQRTFAFLQGRTWGRKLLRRGEVWLGPRPEKRLLGSWWFQTLSGSIGDSTIFHECLLCAMHEYGLDTVDVAFIDDPGHPNNRDNRYKLGGRFKENVISMCCVNPHVGSVFRFNSYSEYLYFLKRHGSRYVLFPGEGGNEAIGFDKRLHALQRTRPVKTSIRDFVDDRLPYDPRRIAPFYEKYGFIPRQSCRADVLEGVRRFLAKHVFPAKPVVVQVRKNPVREIGNNLDIDGWLELVRSRADDTSVRFIFIGHPEELADPRLDLSNVIRSKEHFSSIEEDLALIQSSHVVICNPGGLANFAWYAGVPTLTFNANYRLLPEMTGIPPNGQLPYYTQFQRLFWGAPAGRLIVDEFDRLMGDLERTAARQD